MSPDNFSVTQTQTAPNTQTIISLPVPGTRRLHCTSLTGQRLWGLHRRRPGSPASLRKSQASKLKDRCLHMDVNLKNENYVWILHTQVSNGIYSHHFYILLNYNRAVNINYEKKNIHSKSWSPHTGIKWVARFAAVHSCQYIWFSSSPILKGDNICKDLSWCHVLVLSSRLVSCFATSNFKSKHVVSIPIQAASPLLLFIMRDISIIYSSVYSVSASSEHPLLCYSGLKAHIVSLTTISTLSNYSHTR